MTRERLRLRFFLVVEGGALSVNESAETVMYIEVGVLAACWNVVANGEITGLSGESRFGLVTTG